jgi:two-component system OmpR family sensor kinase
MRRVTLLLLLGTGLVLWILLINVRVVNLVIALPVDLDLLIIFTGLIVVLIAMSTLAFQRNLERLRQHNVERARSEAFAEHLRFLQRLDHELKNPLTAILVGVSNLRETCTGTDQQQVLLNMEIQTKRLSRLVTDLRKLAEIETLPLEKVPFDPIELLEEIATLAQERTETDPRQFSLVLPNSRHITPVTGDRDLIFVSIHNLIDNAFKFTRPGDNIMLEALQEGHYVTIRVSDNGPGILSSDISLVWEELYRGQNISGVPGTGIGLALVQAVVERSGGEVSLESAPGKGTTVTIRLPTHEH